MFPIRDSIPNERTPVVVYGVIALNGLIYLFQISLGPNAAVAFVYHYGFVPYDYFEPSGALRPGAGLFDLLPFLTATFLHGGLLHILLNMWTLFIFGSTLEGRMGSLQFLIFYLCCAVLSIYAHGYFNPRSAAPVIGASGAIAGVIGAYALCFPAARITLLVPIVIIPFIFTIPALAFAAIWFGIQLLQGTWDIFVPSVGGFLAGLLLLPLFLLFAPSRRAPSPWQRGPWD
jgi:membrane associated rhomboid family serine protease